MNIVEEFQVLRQHQHNREVKLYLKAFKKYLKSIKDNEEAPFLQYCFKKYYCNKNIPEVPVPNYYYPRLESGLLDDCKNIKNEVYQADNLISKLTVLKNHRHNKKVQEYVSYLLNYACKYKPYFKYLLDKYYFDLDVPEVKPTAQSLQVTLPILSFYINTRYPKTPKKFKVGAEVVILEGPFKDLIGKVKAFDSISKSYQVEVILFDCPTIITLDQTTKLRRRNKHDRKTN